MITQEQIEHCDRSFKLSGVVLAEHASDDIRIAANRYEERFGITFSHFMPFSPDLLAFLQNEQLSDIGVTECSITVASSSKKTIVGDFLLLSYVANLVSPDEEARKGYLQALLRIYSNLPSPRIDQSILTVAPQREGRILATMMGWLKAGHSNLIPHAKRIPLDGGLVIGLSEMKVNGEYDNCNIIDGAIASGSTIISIIEMLKHQVSAITIFSVHASQEGLNAICSYCRLIKMPISIYVGHATPGVNHKYYAVIANDKLAVGDLGDIIAKD